METRAQFITLDGIDGSGKTTQLNVIRDWFAARQMLVVFTREPGGTPLGEKLRELLLDPQTRVSLHTETLLMFAARRQHLEDVVLPALAQGIHVVSDRFTDATFAYQGGGRGLPTAEVRQRPLRARGFGFFCPCACGVPATCGTVAAALCGHQ